MSTTDGIHLGKLVVHLSLEWTGAKVSLQTGQPVSQGRKIQQPRCTHAEQHRPTQQVGSGKTKEVEASQGAHPPKTQRIKLSRLKPREKAFQDVGIQHSSTSLAEEKTELEKVEEERLLLPREVLKSKECKNIVSELLERGKHLRQVMMESVSTPPTAGEWYVSFSRS